MAKNTLAQAAADIDLDVGAVQARVEAVLGDDLYWFPIRHHSPTAARHVDQVIKARKPQIIFLEEPAEAASMLPHIVDPDTHPPVAIYSAYRDDENVLGLAGILSPAPDIPTRSAIWSPLMAYSPEYITMKTAHRLGIEVVFIDLPHYALLKHPASRAADIDDAEASNTDELIATSDFYQALAKVAGYRSWDEAWDCLFEFGGFAHDTEQFRRELAVFCAAARRTTSRARMLADGTLEREAFMIATIEHTLAERGIDAADAMVICGGFHLFMDRTPSVAIPPIPDGTTSVSLVPYSFFRVSDLSGYAAGNRAPQFYQSWWEHSHKGTVDDLLANHIVAVLKRARRYGEVVSPADAISVAHHARMLAHLRRHETPVLDDIHDAIITCCCKGDPAHEGIQLQRAMDEIDVGRAIGKVTPRIGRLPLVEDFYNSMANFELDALLNEEKRIPVKLDKREEYDRQKSAFLHRLRFLEVPIGQLDDARNPAGLDAAIFREHWTLRWSPQIEPKLTEENLYGDTLEAAVFARLREKLAESVNDAGESTDRLRQAVEMDLPDLIQQMQEQCAASIAADGRLISLAKALLNLTLINRQADFHYLRRDVIRELMGQAHQRACFAIPASASPPDDEQEKVIGALKIIAESVFRDTAGLFDRDLFAHQVMRAADASTIPFVKGALYGLLVELRVLPTSDVAEIITGYAQSPSEIMIKAGDFLDGMLAASRTSIMLGADSLIIAIEALLKAADEQPFLTMLPRIRAAFERLNDHDRDSIALRVAEMHGLKEASRLTALNTSQEAALIIARIDRQAHEIMQRWET